MLSSPPTTMTNEERAQLMYEMEARNWPSPIGWDNLSEASRALWVERVERIQRTYEYSRSGHGEHDMEQG